MWWQRSGTTKVKYACCCYSSTVMYKVVIFCRIVHYWGHTNSLQLIQVEGWLYVRQGRISIESGYTFTYSVTKTLITMAHSQCLALLFRHVMLFALIACAIISSSVWWKVILLNTHSGTAAIDTYCVSSFLSAASNQSCHGWLFLLWDAHSDFLPLFYATIHARCPFHTVLHTHRHFFNLPTLESRPQMKKPLSFKSNINTFSASCWKDLLFICPFSQLNAECYLIKSH